VTDCEIRISFAGVFAFDDFFFACFGVFGNAERFFVGEFGEPFHIILGDNTSVVVEDISGSVIIIIIGHTTRNGSIVISDDGHVSEIANEIAAFVG